MTVLGPVGTDRSEMPVISVFIAVVLLSDLPDIGSGAEVPFRADSVGADDPAPGAAVVASGDADQAESHGESIAGTSQEGVPADTVASVLVDDGAYPTLDVGGFLQTDAAWYAQNEASIESVGDIDDRIALRRVRLNASGFAYDDVHYLVDIEFASTDRVTPRDVVVDFRDVPGLENVRLGYFKQPFGMDALTSSQEFWLIERSLPFAFAPFRQIGAELHGTRNSETRTWAISAYRFPTDALGGSEGENGGYAFAGRWTSLPILDEAENRLVHVGVDYSFIDPGDDSIRYAIQPSFFVTEDPGGMNGDTTGVPVFVDTGPIPTWNVHLFSLEIAGQRGSFHWQVQGTHSLVNQKGGAALGFSSAYAQIGWTLTGESREYVRDRGVFGDLTPRRPFSFRHSGMGAWEVAARAAFIDLDSANIEGGRLREIDVSLNWHANRSVQCQLVLAQSFQNDSDFGDSTVTIIGGRTQVRF